MRKKHSYRVRSNVKISEILSYKIDKKNFKIEESIINSRRLICGLYPSIMCMCIKVCEKFNLFEL
jgi:hypothetical protein